MPKKNIKKIKLRRRHSRLRRYINGTTDRPRLCVYFSGKHIYAQIIDDTVHRTLVSASTVEKEIRENFKTPNKGAAQEIGKRIAEKASANGIKTVIFDRGGFKYQQGGKVAELADAARQLIDF
ncbi:MAG: 50S ribosomal protein L18 [Cyanobacteria bacterium P01_H01_bin.74]